jgi:hypothetical protein
MFSYGQVNVTTSPVEIVAADSEHATDVVLNFGLDEESLCFGDSSVTISTGLLYITTSGVNIYPPVMRLHPGQTLYAVSSSSGGVTVSYLATA